MDLEDIDDWSFLPNNLFVFIEKDDKVYIFSAEIKHPIHQINECKAIWENYNKKRNTALNNYRSVGNKNTSTLDSINRFEEDGFKAYCACFNEKAIMESFMEPINIQAQSIVVIVKLFL